MPNVVEILVVAKDSTKIGLDSAKSGFTGLGGAALGVAAVVSTALVGMGVEAVKMASTFDSQMEKLHTQAGVAQNQIAGLSKGVLDLAGKVGVDPNSLAESLFHVESNFASLGISAPKALDLVKIAAEGAKVGGANLVDVTNALTAAVASGIPGVQDFNQAMGVLNATVGAGDMTMQDLADALGTGVLATVKGFGLSIKDVGAALAVFGDNNIRGAKAGTDLRMAVQALAAPTKEGKVLLEQFGMTSGQLAKDMQSGGLLKALVDLKTHMTDAGITATQQGQIITEMFGKKAGVGVAILFDQLDRLKSKYPDLTKGANNFSDAWTHTKENLKQQFDQIRASFDAMMIRVGEGITPFIEQALPKLQSGLKDGATYAQGLAKAFGFGDTIKSIKKDLSDFTDTFQRDWPHLKVLVEAVAVALAGIVKVFLTLVDWLIKWDTMALASWSRLGDAVRTFASVALTSLNFFVHSAAIAFGWIPGIGPQLRAAASEFDSFKNQANAALNAIRNKVVTVSIQTYVTGAGARVIENQGSVRALGSSIVAYAAGGVIGAASGRVAGGLAWVGEHGAELVKLPVGSTVMSNPDSMAMAQAAGGQGGNLRLEIVGNSITGDMDRMMASWITRLLRERKMVIKPQYVTNS